MTVIDPGIRQRLVRHLENCVTEIDTDISPTIPSNTTQETVYKEVITDKRIPLTTIPKCEPTLSALPAEVLFNRMEVEPIEQEKKARLEPDSSTAEEINNNAETNFRNENDLSRIDEANISQHQLPNSVIKMYDGNFVFVLPSHYIQLAAALGINLNQQQNGAIPVTEVNVIQDQQIRPQIEQNVVQQIEKPINFSKNNEVNDMWRPW